MSPSLYERKLKLYETGILANKVMFTGSAVERFQLLTGARLVFTLIVTRIDAGASISINVKNGFSLDAEHGSVLNFNLNAVGTAKQVVSDIHNLFDCEIDVVGGTVDFWFAVSVADNAMTTRIDNAEIKVDLSHLADGAGKYDSVRVGDGATLLKIRKALGILDDGSIDIYDIGYSYESRVKVRLCSSADLEKAFEFIDVDGVYRVKKIEFTSATLNTNMSKTVKLTRTFTYETADPFNLQKVTDSLSIV